MTNRPKSAKKQQLNNTKKLQVNIGAFLIRSNGAITATELILFYYEKVNYKLKKFEAIFIIRFFD